MKRPMPDCDISWKLGNSLPRLKISEGSDERLRVGWMPARFVDGSLIERRPMQDCDISWKLGYSLPRLRISIAFKKLEWKE